MPADDLSIRRPEPSDADRLCELNEVALRQVDAFAEDAPDDDLRTPRESYVEAGGDFLVGTVDGEIVASGALSPVDERTIFVDAAVADGDGAAVEVTRMRVDPDHQRNGYGRRILAELEERARDLGFEVALLDTTARQTAARGLYESAGYECVQRLHWREYEVLVYRRGLDSG